MYSTQPGLGVAQIFGSGLMIPGLVGLTQFLFYVFSSQVRTLGGLLAPQQPLLLPLHRIITFLTVTVVLLEAHAMN